MHVYLVDGWGGQTSSDQWIEAQIDLIARYRPQKWIGEAGVIQKAIEPALIAGMRTRRVSCRLEWLPSVNDKPTRARSAQSLVQSGRVWVREDHDGDCFLDECAAFPAGRFDDDVDNLSLIGRAVATLSPPDDDEEEWDNRQPNDHSGY
jgi:predicted phage terminase large subunit-like protein